MSAAPMVPIRALLSTDHSTGPNGTPTPSSRYRAPRLNQNTSWTIIGMDRKIHTYVQATVRSTGLRDNRMKASSAPSTNPSTVANATSCRVTPTASTMVSDRT